MERIEELEQMTLDELESFLQEENFNEIALEEQLEQHFSELNLLEEEKKAIGNEDHLVSMVKDVVWQEFMNQVGVKGGTDFIEENRGLTLDLSNDAHIQTAENFAAGKIAKHNYISKKQLEKNYDRFQNTPHKEFRKEYVNPGMDATLERAGTLKKKGQDFVTDIYTGRQIPTETKLENGKNNPKAAQREHVTSSAEIYKDPTLQMGKSNQELADTINDPNNLQGYTTAERNIRKSDKSVDEMSAQDKTKHHERADKQSKDFLEKEKQKETERLKKEGRQTQKEEAFRVGGQMLRTAVITLFSKLMNEIMNKFVQWLKSAKKSLKTLMKYMKEALRSFFKGLKRTVLQISESALTTLLTSIFGPIVRTFKKIWVMLKTSLQSVQEAFRYLTNPANRNEPLEIRIAEVGKIIVAGLSAAGTAGLTPVIEGVLSTTFPPLAFEIPIIGSLSSLIALFLGGTISGVIGAIVIHRINKFSERKQIEINRAKQIDKKNDILMLQEEYTVVKNNNFQTKKIIAEDSITQRHVEAQNQTKDALDNIFKNSVEIDKRSKEINDQNDELIDDLELMMKKLSE